MAWFGLLPRPGIQQGFPADGEFPPEMMQETVPVQRAEDFILDLVVGGRLALRNVREIKAPFDETVAQIDVEVGAPVKADDVLVRLDRKELSTQLDSAWFELTKTRAALTKLAGPPSDADLLEARAAQLTAQEALDKLLSGPTAADSSAASVAIKEAQAAYDKLLARNDPNSANVREVRYAMRQAENELERAQTAYKAVSWRGDLAALSESASLQSATISFESARNAFEEATKVPSELELQQAQLAIDKANNDYNDLFKEATPGEIAQTRAAVARATERVAAFSLGAAPEDVQDAEVAAFEALTRFEDIRLKLLQGSDLAAPIDGVVTKIAVVVDQVVKEGDTVAVVASPEQFELSLTVDENSVLRLSENMPVEITVDAAANTMISGKVTYISPVDASSLSAEPNSSASSSGGIVPAQYPITVEVDDETVANSVRAGMNVQVTFLGSSQLQPNSWLVPANGITPTGEGVGTIEIMRGETPEPLEVEVTEQTQGEWVVVISDKLSETDQVVGSLSTFLNEGSFGPFGPGF